MVYVLLGTGFEEVEAITPVDLLRRAGIEVKTVGITGKTVYGSHNIGIEADILPEEIDFDALDMIVLPGGLFERFVIITHTLTFCPSDAFSFSSL